MSSASETRPVDVAGVEISRPGKVLFPDDPAHKYAVTKLDLARYYADVAEVMLPHLRGRPVNMQRFPDGIGGMAFYEKKVPSHFPDWVSTVEVHTEDGHQRQVVVDDRRSLVYLAQQACITPHTWLCTEKDLERPDQLVFDLDPSDDSLAKVRRATRMVGELLDDLGLTTYLKTTGSRGYHVLVPLRPSLGFDEVRDFARTCGERLAAAAPELLTMEQRKAKRGDRVFVDIGRNAYGQTAVPAYAVRARPGAPVSFPITWDELSKVSPAQVTVKTVKRRLSGRDCPWKDLRRHAQTLTRARRKLSAG
jgi:bifunctional non-homologous end joining protein LigD